MTSRAKRALRVEVERIAADASTELTYLGDATPWVALDRSLGASRVEASDAVRAAEPSAQIVELDDEPPVLRRVWLGIVGCTGAQRASRLLAERALVPELVVVGTGRLTLPVPHHLCTVRELAPLVADLLPLLRAHRRAAAPSLRNARIGSAIAAVHGRDVARAFGYEPPPVRLPPSLDEATRVAVVRALEESHGCKRHAATLLGVSPGKLYRLLHRLEIDSEEASSDL